MYVYKNCTVHQPSLVGSGLPGQKQGDQNGRQFSEEKREWGLDRITRAGQGWDGRRDCVSRRLDHFDLNHKINPLFKQSNRQKTLILGQIAGVAESVLLDNQNPRINAI